MSNELNTLYYSMYCNPNKINTAGGVHECHVLGPTCTLTGMQLWVTCSVTWRSFRSLTNCVWKITVQLWHPSNSTKMKKYRITANVHCLPIAWNHPTSPSVLPRSRWTSMLISSECPLQFSWSWAVSEGNIEEHRGVTRRQIQSSPFLG